MNFILKMAQIALMGVSLFFSLPFHTGNAAPMGGDSDDGPSAPTAGKRSHHEPSGKTDDEEKARKRQAKEADFSKEEADQWVIKAYHDHYGAMPTPLHLQKLLYYWHVESLVRNGKPLANFTFEAWDGGAVNPPLYRMYRGIFSNRPVPLSRYKDIDLRSAERSRLAHPEAPSEPLPEEGGMQKKMLKDVVEFYGSFSGETLSDFNHAEEPWKQAYAKGRNTPITNQVIVDYYSQYPLAGDKSKHREQLLDMFTKLQNKKLSSSEIFELYTEFSAIKESDVFWQFLVNKGKATLNDSDNFFPFLKWSSQSTYHQAVGGFLFFPRELDTMDDTVVSLYQRPRVMTLLACSASFNNPIALYYLSEAFQLQDSLMPTVSATCDKDAEEGDSQDDEQHPSIVDEMAKKLESFSQEKLAWVMETTTKEDDENLLMKGIIAFFLGKTSESLEAFSKFLQNKGFSPDTKQITLAKYHKAVLENDIEELEQLALESHEHSKKVAIAAALHVAITFRQVPSPRKSLPYYNQAAALGSARGYAGLANLAEQGIQDPENPKIAKELYELATTNGSLDAWSTLARNARKSDDPAAQTQGFAYYEKAGEEGAPLAYVHLGNLYETWGNWDEAKKYYRLAAEAGLLNLALISEESDRGNLIQQATTFFEKIHTMATENWPSSS